MLQEMKNLQKVFNVFDFNFKYNKIKVDLPRLYRSTLFILSEELKTFDNIPNIKISINNNIKDLCGEFLVINETCNIILNTKNIKRQTKKKYCHNNQLDSLFYVLLHEIGHVINFIDYFYKSDYTSIYKFFDENWLTTRMILIDSLQKNVKNIPPQLCYDGEIFADKFSLKNLSQFRDFYNYCGDLHLDFFLYEEDTKGTKW